MEIVVSTPFYNDNIYEVNDRSNALIISNTKFNEFIQVDYIDIIYNDDLETRNAHKDLGWFGVWRQKNIR